jgi:myo-inositol-1(or 4)-monophosphatase
MVELNTLDHLLYSTAFKASGIILRGRNSGFTADPKPSKNGFPDYVTNIDKEAQDFIIQCIQQTYPFAIIIAEEGDLIPENINPDSMIWSVDPIDGTGDFIRGTCDVTIMISVRYEELRAAIIYNPFTSDFIQLLSETKTVIHGNSSRPIYKIKPKNNYIIGFDDVRAFQGTLVYDKTFANNGKSDFHYYNRSGSFGDLVYKLVTGQFCAIALTPTTVAPWDSLPGALILDRLGVSRFEPQRIVGKWSKNDVIITSGYSETPMTILTIDSVAKKLGILS